MSDGVTFSHFSVIAALAAGCAALAGCGDDFESGRGDAGSSGSGGSAGSGGASGNGGSAGAGAGGSKACADSTECDDGLTCNGVETCSEGTCQPGTPPCENPDPEHCSVTCAEPTGTCTVSASDVDQDGHKDAKCAADPGDDCDDGSATTYPDAVEECDGKDNDCDALDDLKDGHALAGLAKPAVTVSAADAYDPEVAWCPAASTFVFVWVDTRDGSPNIYAATLSPQGTVGTQKRISLLGNESDPRIACTGAQCAVVWKQEGPNEAMFRPIDCTATPTGLAVSIRDPGDTDIEIAPAVAPFAGGWLTAFSWKNSVGLQASVRAFGLDGLPKGPVQVVQDHNSLAWETSLATMGDQAALAWAITLTGGSPLVVEWARIDKNLTPSPTQALSPKPPPAGEASRGAEIAAHGSNFALAWRHTAQAGASIHFTERSTTGGSVCDTPELGSLVDPRVGGIVSHPNGALVAAVSGAGPTGVSMQLMRAQNCTLLDTHVLANHALESPHERSLAIAGGSQGYATVFAAGYEGSRHIQARVFGPNLCD